MKKFTKEQINQMIVTAVLAVMLAFISSMRTDTNRLTVFADSLLIISATLVIVGVVNMSILKGDYDAITYYLKRGGKFNRDHLPANDYEDYLDERQAGREGKTNVPLYVGIIGVIASLIITYGFIVK